MLATLAVLSAVVFATATGASPSLTAAVPSGVDLAITKTDSADPVVINDDYSYTLTVTNNGPDAATAVSVSDTLPTGVIFVSSADCTAAAQQVTCGSFPLGSGATKTINVAVNAPFSAGDVTNTATVAPVAGSNQVDPVETNNSSSATTTIVRAPRNGMKVLILASTVNGGTGSLEAHTADDLGYDVEVADDTQWAAKTAADFAGYRAIIMGDRSCGSTYTAAENNTAWGPVINGNVIINGTDPVLHGKTLVTQKSVAFALDAAGKTGAYISLSCNDSTTVLNALGTFTVADASCSNDAHVVATHPALVGLSDGVLSGWGCSVHEIFTSWPSDFLVLVIARGIGNAYTAADGSQGTPYILARGRGLTVISDIRLAPDEASPVVGSTHTVTASVTQNRAPLAGKTITFNVIAGPNKGVTGTSDTNSSGQATFSYSSTVTGSDTIEASFVDGQERTQRSNTVTATWTAPSAPPTPPPPTTSTPPTPPPPPPKPDVRVSVDAPQSSRVDQTVTFTATIANVAQDGATGVSANAKVPSGTTLVSAGSPRGACTGTTNLFCPIGTLAGGSSVKVTFSFKTSQAGTLQFGVQAEADNDVAPGNNSSSATTTILAANAQPLPPPAPSTPGTFNAISTGTVKINGVDVTADQVVALKSGDSVNVTNGTLTFTNSDNQFITVSNQQLTARRVAGMAAPVAAGDVTAEFTVDQPATAGALTTLTLVGGDFTSCTTPRSLSATNQTPVRQLWGSAKGQFRTKARYSSATVRGTIWLTQDRCDGSFVRVDQGVVDVLDTALNRTVSVSAGQTYLAKAPTATKKPPTQKKEAKKKAKPEKAASKPTFYLVRNGDSLSSIATSKLGRENRWAEIAKLNGIRPPYKVEPGTRLKLPRR